MSGTNPSENDPRAGTNDSAAATLHTDHGPSLAYRRRPAAARSQLANQSDTPSLPTVVFLSGFKSDMTGSKATFLDRFCNARGLGFLRFDYSGHGESSGDFLDGTISRWTADALAVIDKLTDGPLILVGSSMGGWIMLLVALQRRTRIKGLIGIAAAPDFTEELIWPGLSGGDQHRLMVQGRLEQPSEYSTEPTVITRALIEDGRKHLLLGGEIDLEMPVHLLHGMADPDVPYRHSLRLAETMKSRDLLVTLIKDGDHRLSRPEDLAVLGEAVMDLAQLPVANSARSPSR
jgi:pimeloyl-ACP methyl ester carboxylesterase